MHKDKGKGGACNTQRNRNTDGEKETTIKGNKRMRYTDTRSIAMGYLPKNERGAEPIPGSSISQEEDKVKTKHKK